MKKALPRSSEPPSAPKYSPYQGNVRGFSYYDHHMAPDYYHTYAQQNYPSESCSVCVTLPCLLFNRCFSANYYGATTGNYGGYQGGYGRGGGNYGSYGQGGGGGSQEYSGSGGYRRDEGGWCLCVGV